MPETATLPTSEELRSKLMEQGSKLQELRSIEADKRGDTYEADVRSAIKEIYELDPMLKVAEAHEERAKGPKASGAEADAQEYRSPGQMVVESEIYKNKRDSQFKEGVEVRTLLTTTQTDPAAGLWMPRGTPLPPRPRTQRLFVRDLVSVQETGLNSVPYIRELNAATNEGGATAVAEGGAKPEATMQFEGVDAPVRKIAAWIPVTSEIIEDAPTLRGYIDTRLGYMLALREEVQVLNGAGTGATIRGIRQTTGLQTQAAGADRATTLGLSVSKIDLVDGDADGVAMNPADFWSMVTTRYTTRFDDGYGGGAPFGPPPNSIWGLRVIRTRSMESGKALVGSYALGATIFDRQKTLVKATDTHDDYFIYNKIVILAEERIALAVHRPDFFVEVTLPNA